MDDHELAFCNTFIRREKRQRYRELLANPRRRREILDRLNHNADIDSLRAQLVPASQRTAAGVEAMLRARGAGPVCHVIADALDLDGQEVPLDEALAQAVPHPFAVVLSCVPGRLACFKDEAPGEWLLLESSDPVGFD